MPPTTSPAPPASTSPAPPATATPPQPAANEARHREPGIALIALVLAVILVVEAAWVYLLVTLISRAV